MPPEFTGGDQDDWMRHAESDLKLAGTVQSPGILRESLCFHAQQAVEKALKAVLICLSVPFPKTHNIGVLVDLLPAHVFVPEEIYESVILTDYAVTARYPGEVEPITESEYLKAIALAEEVVRWSKNVVAKKESRQ